jgi:hypothetical protein
LILVSECGIDRPLGAFMVLLIVLHLAFIALCLWYAWLVWLMLRDESPNALIALLVVLALCGATHTAFTYDYPPGYYEDEIKDIYQAWDRLHGVAPLFSAGEGLGVSMVVYAIIQGVLWQFLPAWWAIRLHPMVCGMLVPIGAYAVVRAMRCRPPAAVCAAVAASLTPWALLYSRTSMGIEIVWHQLIVLWLIARAIWSDTLEERRWELITVISIGIALALLIYDYFAGRTVVYMIPLLVLIVPGRRAKLVVLAGFVLGLLLYVPATFYPSVWTYRGFGREGVESQSLWWWRTFRDAVRGFVYPIPIPEGGKSVSMGALMPIASIAGALGLFIQPWRRSFFVLVVFLCGIAPIVASGHVSTHRMLAAAALRALIGWQGITTFFSKDFWVIDGAWRISDCTQYQRTDRPVCYPDKH